MHTFSIIIPHKNIPNLLKRCLDSIPDRDDIQVIVVDDNSDADKVNFQNFPGSKRKNVTLIFDKKGGGAGHARNLGLKQADGKWLVFADADDFFTNNAFDCFLKYDETDYQIVLFKMTAVISETLEPSDRSSQHNLAVEKAIDGRMSVKEAIMNYPGPCAKLFLREFITKNDIWFEEVLSSNDVMFVVKSACLAKNVTADMVQVYVATYRKGSLTQQTMVSEENYLCRLEVKIRRNKFLKNYPFQKIPIIVYVARAAKIGPRTFFKALWITIRTNSFFSGFGVFLKKLGQRIKSFFKRK